MRCCAAAEMIRRKSKKGSETATWKKEREAYQRLPLRLWDELGEISCNDCEYGVY
jgi:hypothetical protein